MIHEYMRMIVNKLEKEFEECLNFGFSQENKMYEYINDLRVINKKVKVLENEP